jgi:hypothetical protein
MIGTHQTLYSCGGSTGVTPVSLSCWFELDSQYHRELVAKSLGANWRHIHTLNTPPDVFITFDSINPSEGERR